MKITVFHKTRYNYEKAVELSSHAVFLKPLQRPYFTIHNYQLKIYPQPQGMAERLSIEGNPFHQVWFNGLTDKLEIQSSFEADIRAFNPFAFIIDLDFIERFRQSPDSRFSYTPKENIILTPYLQTEHSPELLDFANKELRQQQHNLINYLSGLTARVHSLWTHIIREEENLWIPADTFSCKEGSCRDLAWMLIHMLRMQGVATRFVSGYSYNPELKEGHELHAWVEAYLPGAGWIGMDPSLGLFTNENYIPLACSSEAENTLPIHGTYWGAIKAELTTSVEITKNNDV